MKYLSLNLMEKNVNKLSLNKKANNATTTKVCPKCGCDKMVSFHSTNEKACIDCGNTIPWPLENNQKKTF